ncbi:uncharacterized protein [Macaca nemestrina]|uniref:uncharacterized protein n=1 Tax=Macaca nemestrina TaxID=9545 RepID=UPI0039B82922
MTSCSVPEGGTTCHTLESEDWSLEPGTWRLASLRWLVLWRRSHHSSEGSDGTVPAATEGPAEGISLANTSSTLLSRVVKVEILAFSNFQQAYGYGPYSGAYPPGTQVVYAANGQAYAVPYQYPYAGAAPSPVVPDRTHAAEPSQLPLGLRVMEVRGSIVCRTAKLTGMSCHRVLCQVRGHSSQRDHTWRGGSGSTAQASPE